MPTGVPFSTCKKFSTALLVDKRLGLRKFRGSMIARTFISCPSKETQMRQVGRCHWRLRLHGWLRGLQELAKRFPRARAIGQEVPDLHHQLINIGKKVPNPPHSSTLHESSDLHGVSDLDEVSDLEIVDVTIRHT